MKKIGFCCLLFLVSICFLPAQSLPSITIVNNTGYTVWYVRISQTASDTWGSDRLAADEILRNDQSVVLELPFPINVVNRYDIQLEDSDGDTYTKWDVAVSSNSIIVFTFDDIDMDFEEEYDGPPITIFNDTGYEIYEIYISNTASDTWGSDRLASYETLPDGYTITLNLPFPTNVVNRYDLRLVDLDGDSYYKWDVHVAAYSEIVFTFDDIDLD